MIGKHIAPPAGKRILSCLVLLLSSTLANVALTPAIAQETSPKPQTESKQTESKPSQSKTDKAKEKAKTKWIDLKRGWKPIEFGGEGKVIIKDGLIQMDFGDPITGVRWTGPIEGDDAKSGANDAKLPVLPRDNYELRWECRRDQGFDFLCAFTFPIGKERASLVMGGWGGGITGLSSIDGYDASDNQTTMFKAFDNKKWYSARVRVDSKKVTVWVDDTELFDHPREGHQFDIRFEMDPCLPFGIANFECDSQVRNVQIRRLAESEIPKTKQEKK